MSPPPGFSDLATALSLNLLLTETIYCSRLYGSYIWMSHWWHMMVDSAKFWISYQQPLFLTSFSHWQLIQNLVPSMASMWYPNTLNLWYMQDVNTTSMVACNLWLCMTLCDGDHNPILTLSLNILNLRVKAVFSDLWEASVLFFGAIIDNQNKGQHI